MLGVGAHRRWLPTHGECHSNLQSFRETRMTHRENTKPLSAIEAILEDFRTWTDGYGLSKNSIYWLQDNDEDGGEKETHSVLTYLHCFCICIYVIMQRQSALHY